MQAMREEASERDCMISLAVMRASLNAQREDWL
jgi:hypothetical protein